MGSWTGAATRPIPASVRFLIGRPPLAAALIAWSRAHSSGTCWARATTLLELGAGRGVAAGSL